MSVIKCNLSGIVVVFGVPSRKRYEFSDGNNHQIPVGLAENEIWPEDVPDLLSKKQQYGSCCGGQAQDVQIFIEL